MLVVAVRFENPFLDAYRAADFAGLSVDFGVRVNGPASQLRIVSTLPPGIWRSRP